MNYQKIYKNTISDGNGIGVSLYVSGCSLRCKGCHNASAWDFCSGIKYTNETEEEILEALGKSYIDHFSLLGGEIFDQEEAILVNLLEQVKSKYPEKTIWCWTGYEFDQIRDRELTKYLDIAVCGPFKLDLRDISPKNPFRGSTNQRILDSKKSLKLGRPIAAPGFLNNEIGEK